MTEAGPVLAMCLAFAKEPFEVKSGSCGTVVRNAELKIVDPDTGAALGRNLPGEICIRGEQIMKGTALFLPSIHFMSFGATSRHALTLTWLLHLLELLAVSRHGLCDGDRLPTAFGPIGCSNYWSNSFGLCH
jgi:hypothetical protein